RLRARAFPDAAMRLIVLPCRCLLPSGWYIFPLRPRSSLPVAWRCPFLLGLIHTSFHIGGIANAWNRASFDASVTGCPEASVKENPLPRRIRPYPATTFNKYRSFMRLRLRVGFFFVRLDEVKSLLCNFQHRVAKRRVVFHLKDDQQTRCLQFAGRPLYRRWVDLKFLGKLMDRPC